MTGGLSLLIPSGSKRNIDWISFDDLVSYELIQNDDIVVKGGTGKSNYWRDCCYIADKSLIGSSWCNFWRDNLETYQ